MNVSAILDRIPLLKVVVEPNPFEKYAQVKLHHFHKKSGWKQKIFETITRLTNWYSPS